MTTPRPRRADLPRSTAARRAKFTTAGVVGAIAVGAFAGVATDGRGSSGAAPVDPSTTNVAPATSAAPATTAAPTTTAAAAPSPTTVPPLTTAVPPTTALPPTTAAPRVAPRVRSHGS